MNTLTLYLAGGLFGLAERVHNLRLAKELEKLGRLIILPQERALSFKGSKGAGTDRHAIATDCARYCCEKTVLYVGNLDGTDADSGTSVEYGLAVGATGRAVVYRTDFRTDPAQELGVNAMFLLPKTLFIYQPCFATSESEFDAHYQELAWRIHAAANVLECGDLVHVMFEGRALCRFTLDVPRDWPAGQKPTPIHDPHAKEDTTCKLCLPLLARRTNR